jgi:hypothetical protein
MNASASDPTTPSELSPRGSLGGLLAAIALALCAGAASWGIVQGIHPLFHVPKEFEAPNIGMPPEVYLANRLAQEKVERQHAMVYVGLLGALLAGALAIPPAVRERKRLSPVLAAALGLAGGALGGQLGSRVQEYTLEHIGQPELLHTVLAQGAILLPLGLAIGAGLWAASRPRMSAMPLLFASVAAGLIAAVAYPIAMSLFRPTASTDHLLPVDSGSRLLWFLLVPGVFGLLVAVAKK